MKPTSWSGWTTYAVSGTGISDVNDYMNWFCCCLVLLLFEDFFAIIFACLSAVNLPDFAFTGNPLGAVTLRHLSSH